MKLDGTHALAFMRSRGMGSYDSPLSRRKSKNERWSKLPLSWMPLGSSAAMPTCQRRVMRRREARHDVTDYGDRVARRYHGETAR
jgi:hypothetical protein